MKRIIVTKKQLNEYVEKKKTEKIFFDIVETLNKYSTNLNENISIKNVTQSVIADFRRRNLITPSVNEMLIKFNIINHNNEII